MLFPGGDLSDGEVTRLEKYVNDITRIDRLPSTGIIILTVTCRKKDY